MEDPNLLVPFSEAMVVEAGKLFQNFRNRTVSTIYFLTWTGPVAFGTVELECELTVNYNDHEQTSIFINNGYILQGYVLTGGDYLLIIKRALERVRKDLIVILRGELEGYLVHA